MHFDIRSSLLTSFVTSCLGAVLIALLWRQNRRRFPGIGYWLADAVLKALAFLLIGARGRVPAWLSIIGAGTMAVAGLTCLYVGLEEFFDRRTSRVRHVIGVVAFALLYGWLTFVHPSLALRNASFSVALAWIAAQSWWLIERRADPSMRRSARFVSWVMVSLVAVGVLRALFMFREVGLSRDFLESGPISAVVVVLYNIQAVLLVYGLSLLINERLIVSAEGEHQKFAAAFEFAPYAMSLSREEDGSIVEVNQGFQALTGLRPEEVIGKTSAEVALWEDADARQRFGDELARDGSVRGVDFAFRRRDGAARTGNISATRLSWNGVAHVSSSVVDVTEQRKNADELADYRRRLEQMVEQRTVALSVAKEAAEAANRAKTAFLGTMSHELRTPLNAIMGMTEVARLAATDPEQDAQLAMVSRAGGGLLRLVTDLLDLSQLEANRLSLQPVGLTLRAVFADLRGLVTEEATKKDLALTFELPDDLADRPVRGDRGRLVQVLYNLVDNAIKFTDRGGVQVGAALVEEATGTLRVRFTVVDSGPGISPADRGRIFRPFEQLESSLTRRHGGAGLGLAITRRLVEMMGGSITLTSEVGRGSTFSCDVALDVAERAAHA